LRKKLNEPLAERLAFLETHRALVGARDDASVELAALYNLTDQPARALAGLTGRRFHPWEGGEGAVLREYSAACLRLGQRALAAGSADEALRCFTRALHPPPSLGEAAHLLQARADVNHWLGCAHRAVGDEAEARRHFELSAAEENDFSGMAVTAHSPLSYYRGLSLRELGREPEARALFAGLKRFGEERLGQPARIDYFATSLPNLLVFDEDLQARRDAEQHLLIALGCQGLHERDAALAHVRQTLAFTNSDPHALDLLRVLESATNST
jgi:tetratricopeptide (TPR) repeat protein